jgi:hypothetical protein
LLLFPSSLELSIAAPPLEFLPLPPPHMVSWADGEESSMDLSSVSVSILFSDI